MTVDQGAVFLILAAALALFVWGRWRYDQVAAAALLAAVLAGVVPAAEAFAGFGHPAVITVALVLAISRAFINSGLIDWIGRSIAGWSGRSTPQRVALLTTAAFMSMFMNNVGALALTIPVAIQIARSRDASPSALLMPLSFATILGGMVTLIGTPPNLVVSTYRRHLGDGGFGMFDFAPVGLAVLGAGLVFLLLAGRRLLPERHRAGAGQPIFKIADYVTEVRVQPGSSAIGKTIGAFERETRPAPAVLGIIRGDGERIARGRLEHIRDGDILLLRVDPDDMPDLIEAAGIELVADVSELSRHLRGGELVLVEAVIAPGSRLAGRTIGSLRLRARYGINLLAVARQGRPVQHRLREVELQAGDVLLLQGDAEGLSDTLRQLGCWPLAERGLKLVLRRTVLPVAVFGAAIAAASFGLLPVAPALLAALIVLVAAGAMTQREVYDSIDWPVVILLGAMIPVGQALTTTGGAALIAGQILALSGAVPAWAILAMVMIVTMTLSDVMNNAATAVVMAPIAAGIAGGLGVSADPFLMAVAVGSSCAFLTPIGHQNNMLVMGPGGYAFGDYWRLGLPLEALVVAVAVPMIVWVWPF